jgi:hypothetical protein
VIRINSKCKREERGNDAYFTPPQAAKALIAIEKLPQRILDPCCGSGQILDVLRKKGHTVRGSDIVDYGWPGTAIRDYLSQPLSMRGTGIVTNPPYDAVTGTAKQFVEKAIADGCQYHAWLLRMNFLESIGRLPMFRKHPPSRIWISSRRLPMMHREGWEGNKAPSNITYMWIVWDANSEDRCKLNWFDWKVKRRPPPANYQATYN